MAARVIAVGTALAGFVVFGVQLGCGGSGAGVADSGSADSGSADSGSADSGSADSGGDAGLADAGSVDAGVDAGLADAGSVDSGRDSGVDGGDQDGEMPADAGMDGGPGDAGWADARVDAAVDGGMSADCAEQPDFTPCQVVTTPDRDYDVCVGGVCVSPGCGDASCAPPGPNFALADTGQRSCHSDTSTIACPGTACASFCGQDAQHGWDSTNAMDTRYDRTEPVAGEPVVVDTVTGLAWQGCSRGLSGASCEMGTAEEVLWADALSYCDGLDWGGFEDWRLPDVLEGHSLMDYGEAAAVTPTAFPNAPMLRHFTSTSWAGGDDAVWIAPFSGADGKLGVITPASHPNSTGAVRCVRTATPFAYPSEARTVDTTVPAEPVVVDHVTGRSYQGCARGQSGADCSTGANEPGTWAEALDHCETLSYGGADDWRLPDIKELRSIIDNSRTAPGLDPALYPNAPHLPAWSSTTDVAESTTAWSVTVGFGGGIQEATKTAQLTIRCVR